METFVLDTNIFFNMEAGLSLGKKTEEVVGKITKYAIELKKTKAAAFFMPPRAVDEFLGFFEDKNQDFIKEFLSAINIESPDLSKINLSVNIFYKLIENIRERSYRGMNVAEEEIEKAAVDFSGKTLGSKKDFQITIGSFIKKFRDRYRNATRFGFLDSLTDLDLIVLAKQKEGFLVSTDVGVLHWGRSFGVKEMPSPVFSERLQSLLRTHRE